MKPEEEELLAKRQELTAISTTLAEHELLLIDFRAQTAAFEGRYLRQVGILYAELDDWKARVSELRAELDPTPATEAHAGEAREQARQTYDDSHPEESRTDDFKPSAELKRLFREIAKRIHPDLAKDSLDRERRTRLMAEANRAYRIGDTESLQRILNEYHEGADAVEGNTIGAELVRIIRQIRHAKERMSAIDLELVTLRQSEIALLKTEADRSALTGLDLLTELASRVREKIDLTIMEYDTLSKQRKTT